MDLQIASIILEPILKLPEVSSYCGLFAVSIIWGKLKFLRSYEQVAGRGRVGGPKCIKSLWLLLTLLLLGNLWSCQSNYSASSAEIIALSPKNPREFSLQIRPFMVSPQLPYLANQKIRFITDAHLQQSWISKAAITSSSFAGLVTQLQGNIGGQLISLNLSTHDGIARGQSFDSVLALSAYCHLERIFLFAKTKANIQDNFFRRPLTIAVYGEILSEEGNSTPISKADNALYIGSADIVFLLPLGQEEGLPLAMHEGVLAHEFHHRVFFTQVWDNRRFTNLWSLFQSRYDQNQNRLDTRSRILLNALDEGLADVFAVALTGLPDYLNVSLTHGSTEALRKQRDLNGEFAEQTTYDLLLNSDLEKNLLQLCGENADDFTNPKFNIYCLGTVIAKAIYEASSRNLGTLQDHTLPAITSSLWAIAKALDGSQQFTLDVFFEELVNNVSSRSNELRTKLCSELKVRFTSLATNDRIPSCRDIWKGP